MSAPDSHQGKKRPQPAPTHPHSTLLLHPADPTHPPIRRGCEATRPTAGSGRSATPPSDRPTTPLACCSSRLAFSGAPGLPAQAKPARVAGRSPEPLEPARSRAIAEPSRGVDFAAPGADRLAALLNIRFPERAEAPPASPFGGVCGSLCLRMRLCVCASVCVRSHFGSRLGERCHCSASFAFARKLPPPKTSSARGCAASQ